MRGILQQAQVLRPLREPATLMARPSALAATRALWVLVASLLGVQLRPALAPWCPWALVPLILSVVLDAGVMSAFAWMLSAVALVAVLPPGGTSIPLDVLAGVLVVLVTARLRHLIAVTAWAFPLLGLVAQAVHDGTRLIAAAASNGRLTLDLLPFVARLSGAAVLAATFVPPWLRWARREKDRGRA